MINQKGKKYEETTLLTIKKKQSGKHKIVIPIQKLLMQIGFTSNKIQYLTTEALTNQRSTGMAMELIQ